MKAHQRYLGNFYRGGLMVRESRIIAALLLQAPSKAQWHKAIIEDNILQTRSKATAKTIASIIKNRIAPLGRDFLQELSCGSGDQVTQMLLAAMLINAPMLAEFMKTDVKKAKLCMGYLQIAHWEKFWEARTRLWPELAEMSESTIIKIRRAVFSILAQAHYIDNTKNKDLWNVYIDPKVAKLLKEQGHENMVNIMTLER